MELPERFRVETAGGPESLTFSPRGLVRDARWVVEGPGGRRLVVEVHGVTGRVSVGGTRAVTARDVAVRCDLPRRPDQDAGFTLLEVLVALVVLATAVVAVLQLFGGGLRLARAAGRPLRRGAPRQREARRPRAGTADRGQHRGHRRPVQMDRRVALEPDLLVPIETENPDSVRIRLARVSVEVRWGQSRRFELATLRVWRTAS